MAQVGERDGVVDVRARDNGDIADLVHGETGRAAQEAHARAVVRVELLVVEAGGDLLVRRQHAVAVGPHGHELVQHQPDRAAVLRHVLEVELILDDVDVRADRDALQHDHRARLDQAEARRVERAGVAHRLHPGVVVRDQVPVVVKALVDHAQVVPVALDDDPGPDRAVVRRVGPLGPVLFEQVEVLLGDLVGVVRLDLIGHGGDLVAAGDLPAHRRRADRRAVLGLRPDVVIEDEIVVGFDAGRMHRAAARVEQGIAHEPVFHAALVRPDRADHAPGVVALQLIVRRGIRAVAGLVREGERREPRPGLVGHRDGVEARRAGREIADIGDHVGDGVVVRVAELHTEIGRRRRAARRRVHVGVDDQVVAHDGIDQQAADGIGRARGRAEEENARRENGGETGPPALAAHRPLTLSRPPHPHGTARGEPQGIFLTVA